MTIGTTVTITSVHCTKAHCTQDDITTATTSQIPTTGAHRTPTIGSDTKDIGTVYAILPLFAFPYVLALKYCITF